MADQASQVDEIHAAAEAVAGEMERVASLASELGGLFEQVAERVTDIEAKAESLYESALAALDTFATQTTAKIDLVTQGGTAFEGELNDAEGLIQEAMREFASAGQTMQISLQALADHTDGFAQQAQQAGEDAGPAVQQLAGELDAVGQAIRERADQGVTRLGELETAAGQLHEEWRAFVDTLDQRLDQSLQEIGQQIDEQVGNQLTEHVRSFLSMVENIANAVLHDPLTALQDEIVETVREEFTALADQAIEAVDAKFKEIIREILDARDRGDIEEKLMHELFESLRPIFEAVESQFHVVEGIARAVGEW